MSYLEETGATGWISLPRAYILLNIVRVFSILALCGVDALLGFIIVNSFTTHTFFFFDLASYLNLFFLTAFLIVTELPQRLLLRSAKFYLATHWPLLSYSAGLRTLGSLQIVIGIIVLAFINNHDATSRGVLGETWWKLMCAIGAFLIVVGIVNICVTWICMNIDDGGKILSARQIRDPDNSDTSVTPSSCSFDSSRSVGSDVEKGLKISSPVVRTPARAYSQKSSKSYTIRDEEDGQP